jgi:hypothetical protein
MPKHLVALLKKDPGSTIRPDVHSRLGLVSIIAKIPVAISPHWSDRWARTPIKEKPMTNDSVGNNSATLRGCVSVCRS